MHFNPGPFPASDELIAPFWSDVDTRGAGTVWYRNSTAAVDIDFARDYIQMGFPTQPLFTPQTVVVATWHNVGYFDQKSNRVSDIVTQKYCDYRDDWFFTGEHIPVYPSN